MVAFNDVICDIETDVSIKTLPDCDRIIPATIDSHGSYHNLFRNSHSTWSMRMMLMR